MARLQSRINFGVFYDWVAKKGTTAGKIAMISMHRTSRGSVEPEKGALLTNMKFDFWQIRSSQREKYRLFGAIRGEALEK